MTNTLDSLGEAQEISDAVFTLLFLSSPINGIANRNLSLYILTILEETFG